jgi:hypothetical protein
MKCIRGGNMQKGLLCPLVSVSTRSGEAEDWARRDVISGARYGRFAAGQYSEE